MQRPIQLLEELRRDNPLIEDRHDADAAAMSVPTNPQAVLEAIQNTDQEMLAELDERSATDDAGG